MKRMLHTRPVRYPVLCATLLGIAVAGCSPDQTSFFDLEDGEDGKGVAVYPIVAGAQDALGTLPAGSLDSVSLSAAIDCVSALRVTQRSLARQGGTLGAQATDAMRQAEGLFLEHAEAQAAAGDGAASSLTVEIEKKTQQLLESPNEAAQQALGCIRAMSERA